jgi:putative transposase
MYLTLKVKLAPSTKQFKTLLETMHIFNKACNDIAETAFKYRCTNKIGLQKLIYYKIRERYGLSAQMTIRAIAKVIKVYRRNKHIKPKFKPESAVVYDQRILTWKSLDEVSILTIQGRLKIPLIIKDYHKSKIDKIRGQVDLVIVNNTFYLYFIVKIPEPKPLIPKGVLGIDIGIVNIAVDNDNVVYSGKHFNKRREKMNSLKSRLQSKGTKSAKRHLKKISGKIKRFTRDMNHKISKKIVAKAKGTSSMIALEDLKGIRKKKTVSKVQRSYLNSWSFYQLRTFIEYKAKIHGVPLVLIDPKYTSQTCPKCDNVDRQNRVDRDSFKCTQCGFAGLADYIAAVNIAARAAVNQPIVSNSNNQVQTYT